MPTPIVFRDYRGLVQLRLTSPEDLEHIHHLDAARWSSTSVPISQLLCDEALLRYLDTDENGRIRVQELRGAHEWLKARLKNRKRIAERTDTVYLDDLDGRSPEASRLRALAKKRIKASGQTQTGAAAISLADIRSFRDGYAKKFPNGDGVVAPAQIADEDLAQFASLVMAACGSDKDISDDEGVSQERLSTFLGLGQATLDWEAEGNLNNGRETSDIFPFGAETARAFAIVSALSNKLEQFFAQCDLLGHGEAAEEKLTVRKETLAGLDVGDPSAIQAYLQKAALGRPNTEGALYLESWLNPLFASDVRRLAEEVLPRVQSTTLPITKIERNAWEKTAALFEPYQRWQSKRPAPLPSGLSGDALRALLHGPLPEKLRALVAEDQKASAELIGLGDLEKLALLQRWILDLANNMVSFPALFSEGERCLFEVGTLVLDGREMSLCVHVDDKETHRPIAETSNVFVAYAELERKEGAERKTKYVAAGVTSGSRRGIAIGKRGVFYDREGNEWDAKVTDVIVKPISISEAALAPFVKLREFVADKMAQLFGKKLEAMEERAQSVVLGAEKPPAIEPPPPPPKLPVPAGPPIHTPQGSIVGGGIAFAAVGSAAAFALQTLANTNPLNALFAVGGVSLGVMAVSGFLGWLKLRKRDISALLEASGWAFNVRIYLRHNLSHRFTRVPPLPEKSIRERSTLPVFASADEKTPAGRLTIFIACVVGVILLWYYSEPILDRVRHFTR